MIVTISLIAALIASHICVFRIGKRHGKRRRKQRKESIDQVLMKRYDQDREWAEAETWI